MGWRRRRDTETAADPAESDDSMPDPLVPDEAVLDELSRAFGADEPVGAAPGESTSDESTSDQATSDEATSDEATSDEATSDGSASSPAGSEPSPAGAVPTAAASSPPATGAILIVGDDLPDAAYLDDELERDSTGSGPVFIDDDGSSDAVLPKDASSRGIEPRIRQRRIGVKRAENRRRLWWLLLVGAVLVVAIGVLALLGSSLFAVDEVTVTGNVYTDQVALDAIIDDLTGTPVLLVDTDEIEAKVEMIPWVEDARVRTSFPDAASIEIRERTPVAAMMGVDGQARVIDADGRVLGLVDGQPVALVWISGPETLDVAPGQFASIGYSSAASLVTKLTPEIRSRVDSMLVTPDGSDLVLILTSDRGPIEVRFGSALGENAQIEKLVRLQRTLDDVDTKPVTVIDVSTSEVTVR